jgi:hypothetical protein
MAARISGPASRREPAGDGRRPSGRRGNGLVASLHARRAWPLENGNGLLPSRLAHDQRIALDGTPAETVDAEAKDLAAKGALVGDHPGTW